MAFLGGDKWTRQYFDGVDCPADVPVDDEYGWALNPLYNWVYNKLALYRATGLESAPHGVYPPRFPVFSKPIVNLHGMGAGSRLIETPADWEAAQTPGHLWCQPLEGVHISTDMAIVDGFPQWWAHTECFPRGGGTFDYFHVLEHPLPTLETRLNEFVWRCLRPYTGMLNIETIDGQIIEVHLRLTDQYPDLYGPNFIKAVARLYAHHTWYLDGHGFGGYSVCCWVDSGDIPTKPSPGMLEEIRQAHGVSSVQITFYDDSQNLMPPGGFRVAVINCHDLVVGKRCRDRILAL